MYKNGRKNICVVLCDVSEHYQEQVCKTITSLAGLKGYNVAYFSFFLCYGVDTKNGAGEANIINLIPYEKFDGFIICHDTFQNQEAVERLFKLLEDRTKAPIITIRRQRQGFPCVLTKKYGAIAEIVRHFVDVHGFKRIAYYSGPLDHPDAALRFDDYKKGLESRGIEFDENMVFYGDFWRTYSKDAARHFMMELAEPPQAIVCGNDYMAISLSNELINMGTIIPDDVAISGYDDIWEAGINMPPITTVTVPADEMTKIAFCSLEKLIAGEEVPEIQTVDTKLTFRSSCGCKVMDFGSMLKKRVRQNQEQEKILDSVQENTYMFADMSEVDSAEALVDNVRLLDDEDNNVKNFFICLGEDRGEEYPKYFSNAVGYPKQMKAVGSVMNRRIIHTDVFDTEDLLPPEATTREPMIYFFFALHSLDVNFGYFAISYSGVHGCDRTFHSWKAILGNALENVRLKKKAQVLVKELNNLYVHDALTGLYNRRGFENNLREMYVQSRNNKKSMVIISIDMDNLKVVNDRFGHAQGDLALQTIARAMEYASMEDDYCARVGGDEFSVIGVGYDEQMSEHFAEKFNEFLEDFNEKSHLPYYVRASIGYMIITIDNGISLDEAIVESDNELYRKKKEKKAKKLDVVLRFKDLE